VNTTGRCERPSSVEVHETDLGYVVHDSSGLNTTGRCGRPLSVEVHKADLGYVVHDGSGSRGNELSRSGS